MLKSRWTENGICSVSFCLCVKYTNRNFTGIKYCFVLQNRKFVIEYIHFLIDAGWSSLVARRAHNPKVVGSNPAPATIFKHFSDKSLFNKISERFVIVLVIIYRSLLHIHSFPDSFINNLFSPAYWYRSACVFHITHVLNHQEIQKTTFIRKILRSKLNPAVLCMVISLRY